MSQKILFIISDQFPYGQGETFLETESNYYDKFDSVIILSNYVGKKTEKRKLNNKIKIIRPEQLFFRSNSTIIKMLYSFNCLFSKKFYKELVELLINKKLNFETIIHLISYTTKSNLSIKYALKWLIKNVDEKDFVTFYSYWLYFESYIATQLSKKAAINSSTISRVHGFDLYEERHPNSYIPYRKNTLSDLNMIYPISKSGKKYLTNKYPELSSKVEVSYLGTLNEYKTNFVSLKADTIHIVSCSRLVPLKRVELIIEALELLSNEKIMITWSHIGDGELKEQLVSSAERRLSNKKNIKYNFLGHVKNSDIRKLYSEQCFDIFINVSTTEGLPVSIMEAASFGIPIIATNVGGTNEIVDEKNGFLLDKDFKTEELVNLINGYTELTENKKLNLRIESRNKWLNNFNASSNYTTFFEEVYFTSKRLIK